MSYENVSLQVLEEFASVAVPCNRLVATEEGGLEALRAAYRARQALRGECRSCRRPAAPGRKSCAVHLAKAIDRALRSQGRP